MVEEFFLLLPLYHRRVLEKERQRPDRSDDDDCRLRHDTDGVHLVVVVVGVDCCGVCKATYGEDCVFVVKTVQLAEGGSGLVD